MSYILRCVYFIVDLLVTFFTCQIRTYSIITKIKNITFPCRFIIITDMWLFFKLGITVYPLHHELQHVSNSFSSSGHFARISLSRINFLSAVFLRLSHYWKEDFLQIHLPSSPLWNQFFTSVIGTLSNMASSLYTSARLFYEICQLPWFITSFTFHRISEHNSLSVFKLWTSHIVKSSANELQSHL